MSTSIVVAYPFTPEALAEQVDGLRGLPFTTPQQYKVGVQAIAQCRNLRVQIEERRKLLKQDSLEYGRKVDAVAKQLTEIIARVEEPLKVDKLEVDNAKAREKEAAEAAKRAAVEAEIRAKREAEEAELAARRMADEERLRQERAQFAAERAAAAEERLRFEKEREAMRAERAALESERKAREAEREAQRLMAEEKREAAERAEREAAEAEEKRIHQLEYEAQRKARLEALKPDREKLNSFADALEQLIADEWVQLERQPARQFFQEVADDLKDWVRTIRDWEMP